MARYRRRGGIMSAGGVGIPNPNYYNPRPTVDSATGSVLTAVGSVNPNFGNTTAGRRQAAQERADMTQAQLREIQQQALGMGQQINPQASPEARAERARQAAVGQGIAQGIGALSPFAGVLGPEGVQRAVSQMAGDVLGEQRRIRQADKDAQAIAEAYSEGTIDIGQATGAIEQYQRRYGNLGLRAPNFQELVGVREQAAMKREELMQSYADERGVDRRFVSWDDRANRPVPNREEYAVERMEAEIAERAAKPRTDITKAVSTMQKPEPPRRRDFKNEVTGKVDESAFKAAERDFQRQGRRWTKLFGGDVFSPEELDEFFGEESRADTPSLSQQLSAGLGTGGEAPVVQATPIDPQAASAAVNAGKLPEGVYIAPDGRKFRVTKGNL